MTREDYKILSRHARIINQEVHKVTKKIDALTNAEVSEVTYSTNIWHPLDWPAPTPVDRTPAPVLEVFKPNALMCKIRLGVNWLAVSVIVLAAPVVGAVAALPVLLYAGYHDFKKNVFKEELKTGTIWFWE